MQKFPTIFGGKKKFDTPATRQGYSILITGDDLGNAKNILLLRMFGDESYHDYIERMVNDKLLDLHSTSLNAEISFKTDSGQEAFTRLRTLNYPHKAVILIVYDVSNKKTLKNAKDLWFKEAKQYNKDASIILLGLATGRPFKAKDVVTPEHITAVIKQTGMVSAGQISLEAPEVSSFIRLHMTIIGAIYKNKKIDLPSYINKEIKNYISENWGKPPLVKEIGLSPSVEIPVMVARQYASGMANQNPAPRPQFPENRGEEQQHSRPAVREANPTTMTQSKTAYEQCIHDVLYGGDKIVSMAQLSESLCDYLTRLAMNDSSRNNPHTNVSFYVNEVQAVLEIANKLNKLVAQRHAQLEDGIKAEKAEEVQNGQGDSVPTISFGKGS